MFSITPDDIIARMRFDNPWWVDEKIPQQFGNYPKRDYFAPFQRLVCQKDPHRSVILLGPRRTGKTVMLIQFIASQMEKDTPARNLFYISLDTPIYARQSLEQLLNLFQSHVFPDITKEIYVIFDEVQYLKSWEAQLKSLTDSYHEIKFIVSGSAAAALKTKSEESGAGRFTDFTLPPLTFAEFLRMTKREDQLIVGNKKTREYETTNIKALNEEFVRYINFGGFPELALSNSTQADIARFIKDDILDKVLLRDLPSIYGIDDTTELYALFTFLAFNTGNEVSLDALSTNANISKNTLKKYIEFLEAAFLIRTVERIDKTAKNFKRSGTFKVYLANPSIRAALFGPMHDDDEKFGHMAETAVFAQWMHSKKFKECIRFARWDESEVDMVFLQTGDQNPLWAVEVKWSDRHVNDARLVAGLVTLGQKYPMRNTIATTRTISGTLPTSAGSIKLIPTSLYCYGVVKQLLEQK
jgi:uncharacterized protein